MYLFSGKGIKALSFIPDFLIIYLTNFFLVNIPTVKTDKKAEYMWSENMCDEFMKL